MISDDKIEKVHANANFGEMDKRDVLRESILKVAAGYHISYTALHILFDHKLVCAKCERPTLTPMGKKYLWATYKTYSIENS
tara:strand:- start:119 stop:364 length:246 start_codon:yes stop_codon:yes gene_type:complete